MPMSARAGRRRSWTRAAACCPRRRRRRRSHVHAAARHIVHHGRPAARHRARRRWRRSSSGKPCRKLVVPSSGIDDGDQPLIGGAVGAQFFAHDPDVRELARRRCRGCALRRRCRRGSRSPWRSFSSQTSCAGDVASFGDEAAARRRRWRPCCARPGAADGTVGHGAMGSENVARVRLRLKDGTHLQRHPAFGRAAHRKLPRRRQELGRSCSTTHPASFFCVVDYHAITRPYEPAVLRAPHVGDGAVAAGRGHRSREGHAVHAVARCRSTPSWRGSSTRSRRWASWSGRRSSRTSRRGWRAFRPAC